MGTGGFAGIGPITFAATAAWQAPTDEDPGFQIVAEGCTLERISLGIVRATLENPLAEDSVTVTVTQRGIPIDAYAGVVHTSDTEKDIVFKPGGNIFVDASFDVHFLRVARNA